MQFDVDDNLAALVERLAKKIPFENLSFNDALRRLLENYLAVVKLGETRKELEELLAESVATAQKEPISPNSAQLVFTGPPPAFVERLKKARSPKANEWASMVAELRAKRDLNTWKAICDVLKINTAGDSA